MDLSLTSWSRSAQEQNLASLRERMEHLFAKRWFITIVNLAALSLLTAALAQWTWQLLVPVSPSAVSGPPNADLSSEYDINALFSANLFGRSAEPSEASRSLSSIPLSSLNLILTGVMVTPNGSFALISANNGPETPFEIGQDIIAGATLEAVYADRVLIRRVGVTESLMLKETSSELPSDAIIGGDISSSRNITTTDVRKTGNYSFSIPREQLTQQMQRPEFLRQALMVPNANGGFLVREIQSGSLYEKLGLRVGDVINTINGQSVNTVDDVMKLYQQLNDNQIAQVNLDIRRAGRNETLHYNLK